MVYSEPTSQQASYNKANDQWTDQETLLLLEGLELYHDNWDQIAEYVGTKTKEQCLLHFVRLPVEDSFAEDHFASKKESSGIYICFHTHSSL